MIDKALQEYKSIVKKFNDYVDELYEISWKSYKEQMEEFIQLRGFSEETIRKAKICYIPDNVSMLIPEYIPYLEDFGVISNTNEMPIYQDRYMIPIRNMDGDTINTVGYSSKKDTRYVYGTGKYYDRADTIYGLENYKKAVQLGWGIYTEGITDTIAIRNLGFENCFAACGTRESDYKNALLNVFRHGVIRLRDRDVAGDNAVRRWNFVRYIDMYVPINCKDPDQFLNKNKHLTKEEAAEEFKRYILSGRDWLLSKKHMNIFNEYVETTIM